MRSHIIPRFHYKALKKGDGFFYQISTDPAKPERKLQKEMYERLFCARCDNEVLQENEDYLARILYGGTMVSYETQGRAARVKGLDYRKVKNGLLSILWRMSLSTDAFFSEVDLGAKHSERIRNAILNREILAETEYGIHFCIPTFENRFLGDLIAPPDFARVGGNRVYRCVISGFLFTFHVGSAGLQTELQTMNLMRDGSWLILKTDVMKIPFLRHFCVRMGKAQQVRKERFLSG